ncbi:MAG: hypothetical protein Q9191_007572 [Dirinaria sp. TL-2023a]
MPTSIEDLPFEILCIILEEVARDNLHQLPSFTYGLSHAAELGLSTRLQRVVRGQTTPDVLAWQAIEGLRKVNQRWHEWAIQYAFRSLYISRWRGSERWLQSRSLDRLTAEPSSIAVYRDPYLSLRKTADLFASHHALAASVQRLWFNGYYTQEANALILNILNHCSHVDHLTLPWTTLRYGSKEDWSRFLSRAPLACKPLSLEFLAVNLGEKKIYDLRNQVDYHPLDATVVDFRYLERLKIFGNTNFKPITDDDLFAIARTAKNLREVHVTATCTITIAGVMALVEASRCSLQVLEFSPLAGDGFVHPKTSDTQKCGHLCTKLLQCPRLQSLAVSLPSVCEHLFEDASVNWSGEVQIRAERLCNHRQGQVEAQHRFWRILDLARSLMAARSEKENVDLDIQLFIDYWIFEPKQSLVHGNIEAGQALSDYTWPADSSVSGKGPYGQTGLYGKDERPYSCMTEEAFTEGLRLGYVSF